MTRERIGAVVLIGCLVAAFVILALGNTPMAGAWLAVACLIGIRLWDRD